MSVLYVLTGAFLAVLLVSSSPVVAIIGGGLGLGVWLTNPRRPRRRRR